MSLARRPTPLRAAWLAIAVALALLAARGGALAWPHAALALASLALALAPLRDERLRALLRVAAAAFLAAAALGAVSPRLFGYPERLGWPLRLDVATNLAHLAIGAWSAYAAKDGKEG